ncbi:TPA: methyltransferase domain-containing protein [Aeromonas veronii]|uniref:spermidine synthase n=1 Tax=Aeromonas veronii TaxID=654 RepID=UPI0033091647|nr:methyltransferase domain-containing protein [Aeromonas veronii]HDO1333631.1 methyltransferase domain-containing protein [Aeromonas veronii]HDO1339454.1 methyltransferase domain-containing protein [Aeromonas veronii]HDO1342706.1 methyltransferase domain-containing protein [Aeromonas veronii]HDO1347045.1 methyltransferase domain-containing protein [Aeromonas veronii]
MDFNLQAYQADHLLHLSVKPQRRLTVQENDQHRWLEIDGVVQSAMSLADPATLCLPHQRVIACLLPEQATQILELGLGGGDLTRHLCQRWPDVRHECVDLDEEVLTVYQQFFQHQAHDGQAVPTLHQADALAFLEQSEQQYDLILLDLFSQDGNPLLLFQERLYRALAPRLNGTLVINLLPRTALELTHALTLIEQWIGPATPYPVAGLINVIVHVTPRDETSSDL